MIFTLLLILLLMWSIWSCQDKKQSITNPKYLMLYDCSRYWSAIFRGGWKLELTFCLGWKTRYFVLLKFRVNHLNKAILLPAFNFNGQSLKLPDERGPTISDHTKQHCRNKRSVITPEAWTPVIINMYVCMYVEYLFQLERLICQSHSHNFLSLKSIPDLVSWNALTHP